MGILKRQEVATARILRKAMLVRKLWLFDMMGGVEVFP